MDAGTVRTGAHKYFSKFVDTGTVRTGAHKISSKFAGVTATRTEALCGLWSHQPAGVKQSNKQSKQSNLNDLETI